MTAEFAQAARRIAEAGRELHARGWVPATSGNFSMRLADGDIAITASGRDKSQLQAADVLRLSADGDPRGPGRPSAETALHLQLYARDPRIGAVLHTHSVRAALVCGKSRRTVSFTGLELLKAFDGVDNHQHALDVPVFDNDQDIAALAVRVEQHMQARGTGHAYLIRGHGVYTWGPDLGACLRQLEALEYLFEYDLESRRLPKAAEEQDE